VQLLAVRLLAARCLQYSCLQHSCLHIRLHSHRCTRLHALTRHTLAAHCSPHARLMTLLALLTPFMLSLLHAGRINCCYRSVRVRLVATYRIFASLTAAQLDHSVLTAFRSVRASTTPAQHSSSMARSAGGWPKPAAILKFNFKLLMAGDHYNNYHSYRSGLGPEMPETCLTSSPVLLLQPLEPWVPDLARETRWWGLFGAERPLNR
jgi:hypothetical protein